MDIANTVITIRFIALLLFFICHSHKQILAGCILLGLIYFAGCLGNCIAKKSGLPFSIADKTNLLFNRIFHLSVYLYLFDKSYISFWLFFVIFVRYLAEIISIPFFKWLKNTKIELEVGRYANMALTLSIINVPAIILAYHYKLWTVVKLIQYGPIMASFLLEAYLLFKLLSQITSILHKKD